MTTPELLPVDPRTLGDACRALAPRLRPHVRVTPMLEASAVHGSAGGVWYKCENLQRTGSFKLRGALAKVLSLSADARARGVITASTGNHGLAVGTALRIVGGQGTAYVARSAAPLKVAKLRATGMQIVTVDGDALEAERTARRVAAARGAAYISPYNDPEVIVGQGTVGVEMLEQLPSVCTVFIACGGGGLLGGIGGCLRAARPDVRLVACWPENSPALNASIDAGRVVEAVDLPTLSDGTAGNLEEGSITLPLCRDLVDERVLVSEREIAAAMRDVLLADHLAIEGAAGVAVAAYRRVARERPDLVDGDTVIVLCGGNVDAATLRRVLEEPA